VLNKLHITSVHLLIVAFFALAIAAPAYSNLISPGPLTKHHSSLEGTDNCVACHEGAGKTGISTKLCLDCHQPIKTSIDNNEGYHAKVSRDCATCHKEHIGVDGRLIRWDPKAFNHNETGWKLEGKHETTSCSECHKKKDSYVGLSKECLSCHKDQHGSDLKRGCLECHGMQEWKQPAPTFDHAKTKWALTGKHVEVECLRCHKENKWSSLSTDCKSCHSDPHNGKFNQKCTECHSPGGWKNIVGFDHSKTGFVLVEAHAILKCDACHNQKLKPVLSQKTCVSCHTDRHNGQLSTDCQTCHNQTKYIPSIFTVENHAKTNFALLGKHADKACNVCHKDNHFKFTPEQKTCGGCHQDYHKGQLSTKCENCHSNDTFKPSLFTVATHDTTRFKLTGKHATITCTGCHKENRFAFTAKQMECLGCHKDQHQGQFNATCTQCHSMQAWKPTTFGVAQHSTTNFILTGKHATTECNQCHKEGKYKFADTERTCFSCHEKKDAHNGTFGKNCEQCHSPQGWKTGVVFNHRLTRFALEGTHLSIDCKQCHVGGKFAGTPMECNRCHTDVHQGYLSQTCNDCHRSTQWNDIQFVHTQTRFPLTNRHATLVCVDCHKTQRFADTPTDCFTCHQKLLQQTTNPNHTVAGFSTQCTQCHSNGGPDWSASGFAHSTYALVGPHQPPLLTCNQCHATTTNNQYRGTPRDCNGCHSADYTRAGTLHVDHLTYPHECESCHAPTSMSWNRATFAHTTFPLVGQHASPTITCTQCHINNQFTGTPTDCYTCHWTRSQDDLWHLANGTTCGNCHNPNGWTNNVQFDHNAVAHYQLQGAHAQQRCIDCHTTRSPQTDPRKTNCVGCHQTVYNQTTNPNHVQASFGTVCSDCHYDTDNNWYQARTTHTFYPLNGNHASPNPTVCSACHPNNRYAGTPNDCYSCHQLNYTTAANPPHNQTTFPSAQCGTCHISGGPTWSPATFDHSSIFPLQNSHTAPPRQCTDCHTGGNYTTAPTDCYGCHQANYSGALNPPHNQTTYPSGQCGTCHTNGGPSWSPANFNHSTVFPLLNSHTSPPRQCADCHSRGFANTPTDCYGCHQANYTGATNPVHTANAYPPSQCANCHSNGGPAWQPAQFNHDAVYQLVGQHQVPPRQCSDCHIGGVYAGTSRDCYGCHQLTYSNTTNPHHDATSFPPAACANCHSNSAASWSPSIFNHSTVFALNGAHATTACALCHINSQFAGTPTDCYTCHWTRHQDDLWTLQIGQNCGTCHDPAAANGWTPTHDWTHPTDAIVGQGLHVIGQNSVTCLSCHPSHVITGTTTVCYSCHQANYPTNHQSSSTVMTTTCNPCHLASHTAWTQGTLAAHTWFPITSGNHRNITCINCHTNTSSGNGSFLVYDCITCHGGCSNLTNRHSEVSGFTCVSSECYRCHPSGNSGFTRPHRGATPTPVKF